MNAVSGFTPDVEMHITLNPAVGVETQPCAPEPRDPHSELAIKVDVGWRKDSENHRIKLDARSTAGLGLNFVFPRVLADAG